jgi:hypothetical protein
LGGLSILQERWSQAVAHYREVLQSVEENKEIIKADKLQKIHCLRNLDELLNSNHEGIQRKEKEQDLVKEAEQLESLYLAKFTATVSTNYFLATLILQHLIGLRLKAPSKV